MNLEKKELLSLLKLYNDKKFNDLEIKISNLLN